MRDPFRDQAWSEFSARLYELAVSCVRVAASDNESTRQERGAAMAEVFFSATALAVPHERALAALDALIQSLTETRASVERDLTSTGRLPDSGRTVQGIAVEQGEGSPSNDLRVHQQRRLT
jgi:hypothetical protein